MNAENDPNSHESKAKRYLEQFEETIVQTKPEGLYYPKSYANKDKVAVEVNATLSDQRESKCGLAKGSPA